MVEAAIEKDAGALDRLQRALDAFDQANAADPNLESVDGEAVPKELIYGQRMSAWLARLCPRAFGSRNLARPRRFPLSNPIARERGFAPGFA